MLPSGLTAERMKKCIGWRGLPEVRSSSRLLTIRTGRFDSVVVVAYPSRTDAARILAALLSGMPRGEDVDTAAVAASLPPQTSGSDLREIVRRAVLTGDGDGTLSTAALLAEVGSGRYRAELPGAGTYL